MAKEKDKQEQQSPEEKAQDEKRLIEWLNHKEKALDFMNIYSKKIAEINRIRAIPIEKHDAGLLREQISDTYAVVWDASVLAAKAERQYREMQKEAALRFPSFLRSDARRMWLDGECAEFRYQRDIFEYMLQGLRDKLSGQKTALSSITREMIESRSYND